METNKNRIIHYRSDVTVDNKAKLPSADSLEYGEFAINYADGVETIAFKNKSNKIVEIRSNEYIEGIIKDNEEVIAASLTELNQRLETVEVLNGDDTVEGSVANTVKDAVNDVKDWVSEGFASTDYVDDKIGVLPDGKNSVIEVITDNELIVVKSFGDVKNNINEIHEDLEEYKQVVSDTLSDYATQDWVNEQGFTKNIGTVTSVIINGETKNPSNGIVDLGEIVTDANVQAVDTDDVLDDVDAIVTNLAYVENTSTSGTVTLLPNTCIYMPNVLTGNLTINACSTLSSNNDVLIESRICFRMPNSENLPTIQFNGAAVRWAGGNAPVFEADFTYEVSLFYPSNAGSVGPMGVCIGFK